MTFDASPAQRHCKSDAIVRLAFIARANFIHASWSNALDYCEVAAERRNLERAITLELVVGQREQFVLRTVSP